MKTSRFVKRVENMEAIIIEGNSKTLELIIQIADATGARAKKLTKNQLLEFQTGNRLKSEKTGKRVPKSEIMKILRSSKS